MKIGGRLTTTGSGFAAHAVDGTLTAAATKTEQTNLTMTVPASPDVEGSGCHRSPPHVRRFRASLRPWSDRFARWRVVEA